MNCELKRPYPRIRAGGALSYGGSQNWFPGANFRACGCGVVACADTLLYLEGRTELSRDEYRGFVDAIGKKLPLIPGRGIDGLRLAHGMNVWLRRRKLPLRASWCFSGRRFWDRVAEQLARDVPVILSIGPCLPRFWDKDALTLCVRTPEGAYVPEVRTQAHFLTATGLDDDRLRVSSWGRELYIERAEYDRYRASHGAPLSNLLYLREK